MPFNGSGTFDPLPPPDFPAVSGSPIVASYFNAIITDILTQGLSRVVARDGQSSMSGALQMGGNKIQGLDTPVANTDAATKAYVDTVADGLLVAEGATTVGLALLTEPNPSAIRFIRVNADNSVDMLSATDFRTAIGVPVAAGTVTSVSSSSTFSGVTLVTTNPTTTPALVLAVSNAATARSSLSAASSGTNTDITSLEQDTEVAATGTATATSLGFRGIPIITTTGKTLALTDLAGDVYTSGNVTIPANSSVPFPVGGALSITNSTGTPLTITITTDTLRWYGSTSSTRTLAAYGTATIHKKASTLWFIKGDVT